MRIRLAQGRQNLRAVLVQSESWNSSFFQALNTDIHFFLHLLTRLDQKMNRIQNGWFSEVNDQWPGQALSLEVDEILFEGKSKHQDILVFKRYVPPRIGRFYYLSR